MNIFIFFIVLIATIVIINIVMPIAGGLYRNYWLKTPYVVDNSIVDNNLRISLEISPHTLKITYTYYDGEHLNEHSTSSVRFFWTPAQMRKQLTQSINELVKHTQENCNVYTD